MATATPTINCIGLSTTLTLLRIKQALLSAREVTLPLNVSVGEQCDRHKLIHSLGAHAKAVKVV